MCMPVRQRQLLCKCLCSSRYLPPTSPNTCQGDWKARGGVLLRGTVAQHTPRHLRPASSYMQVANTGPKTKMKSGDYPESNAGQHGYGFGFPLKKERATQK